MQERVLDADFLEQVWRIAREAGVATLEHHRRSDLHVEKKDDDSPVTAADLASQEKILAGLRILAPEIPWLSEEDEDPGPDPSVHVGERGQRRIWLVDPLDGTREFIAGRDEFTVNIALIENGEPVLGVVVAPALDRSYLGLVGQGAWRQDESGERQPIEATGTAGEALMVVASRSHRGTELDTFLESLPEYEITSIGSSLKLCLLAEGTADFYPRLSPTMEWDIAAAHAVLRAAGGEVQVYETAETLRYDRELTLNPHFIATSRRVVRWSPPQIVIR